MVEELLLLRKSHKEDYRTLGNGAQMFEKSESKSKIDPIVDSFNTKTVS